MKKINWKLFSALVGAGIITNLMVQPFSFALIDLPDNIPPMGVLVLAQTLQAAVMLSIACFMGLLFVNKTELAGVPVLGERFGGEKKVKSKKRFTLEAILWGLIGSVIMVLLCIPWWNLSIELMTMEMNVALWKSILACFYGGVGEEILFRLGMMTFLVWLFCKMKLKKSGYWIAIIITGIVFGLGHIGITSGMTAITPDVILRAVLLNGSVSVIYGVLYWKRGLESAMIAHFSTDVILHIVIPHIIAPIFM